jgi:phosphoribosylaminoimidazolecarboxamide formyltransferase/IMP cyclohydrolase
VLAAKKKLRVLEVPAVKPAFAAMTVRSVPGGLLAQSADDRGFDRGSCSVVSRRQPTDAEWQQLRIAWLTAKHVKSNAIVLARDGVAVGIGAGQMSRVEAVRMAAARAGDRSRGSVMASDAFFPFPDGIEEAARAGVTAVIQPGGSVRDSEVVAAADAHEMAMVTTGERHFRH